MFKRVMAAALVFGMAATGPPQTAQAQIHCASRPEIVKILKQRHGETALGIGLAGSSAAYEVWRRRKTGSWTILMTRPDNISCIMATGDSWMEDTQPPGSASAAAINRHPARTAPAS